MPCRVTDIGTQNATTGTIKSYARGSRLGEIFVSKDYREGGEGAPSASIGGSYNNGVFGMDNHSSDNNDSTGQHAHPREEDEEDPQLVQIVLTDRQLRSNRTYMTMIHFVLTYPRWSLTLFLLLAHASLPLPSAQEAVQEPLQNLRTIATEASHLYHECTVNAFENHNATLHRLGRKERNRLTGVRQRNQVLIHEAWNTARRASQATQTAQRALRVWRSHYQHQQEQQHQTIRG